MLSYSLHKYNYKDNAVKPLVAVVFLCVSAKELIYARLTFVKEFAKQLRRKRFHSKKYRLYSSLRKTKKLLLTAAVPTQGKAEA